MSTLQICLNSLYPDPTLVETSYTRVTIFTKFLAMEIQINKGSYQCACIIWTMDQNVSNPISSYTTYLAPHHSVLVETSWSPSCSISIESIKWPNPSPNLHILCFVTPPSLPSPPITCSNCHLWPNPVAPLALASPPPHRLTIVRSWPWDKTGTPLSSFDFLSLSHH